MELHTQEKRALRRKLRLIQIRAIQKGIDPVLIRQFDYICNFKRKHEKTLGLNRIWIITVGAAVISVALAGVAVEYLLSARCLLPINHLVWEATRPLADCSYCANVTKPFILQNITRRNFRKYAYSSKPIIVKQAIKHWKAKTEFTFYMFKNLYEQTIGSYESLEDGCQFLNFKTDLFTLKEVFDMPSARVQNEIGQKPWYVGWGNCHPNILAKLREYYTIPDFLPKDAEFPATENIFFGYEMGAVLHLDYIPRLMWQGQVKGNKTWSIIPVPECEDVCQNFQYYVEPGDVVLLDTRLWYHSTSIPKGEFSLTVQSEYG